MLERPGVPFEDDEYEKVAWSKHIDFGHNQDEKCLDTESEEEAPMPPVPDEADDEDDEVVADIGDLQGLDEDFVAEMANDIDFAAQAALDEGSSGSSSSTSSSSSSS